MMATTDTAFRVWIGCLACYNDGRLTGSWHDADTAGEVTTRALHAAEGITTDDAGYVLGQELYGPHEELWVMDTDNAPAGYSREMSPSEAQAIAERLEEVSDEIGEDADAFAAWCANNGEDITTADVDSFRDSFVGHFDSFRDYSDEYAEEQIACMVASASDPDAYPKPKEGEGPAEWLASYFDYERFADEMDQDHWTHDTATGVYVFRSY